MTPTPTLPPVDLNDAFLEMASKRFADSYKWLNEQYDNKCKRLADYAGKETANQKYVLQETAFLTALYHHISQLKKHSQCIDVIMKDNNDQGKQIRIMQKIFTLYGISLLEIEGYLMDEAYLDTIIKLAREEKRTPTPIAIQKHLKQEQE